MRVRTGMLTGENSAEAAGRRPPLLAGGEIGAARRRRSSRRAPAAAVGRRGWPRGKEQKRKKTSRVWTPGVYSRQRSGFQKFAYSVLSYSVTHCPGPGPSFFPGFGRAGLGPNEQG